LDYQHGTVFSGFSLKVKTREDAVAGGIVMDAAKNERPFSFN
jgi:hypothetical protein